MSAVLYDKALIEKLKKWTEKTDVYIYGPSETARMYQIRADNNNDEPFKLPAITLSRNGYTINNQNKRPMSYDGVRIYADEEKVKQINAIPITLEYSIDVYTRFYEEADSYMREIIFNVINYPQVSIKIPYLGFNTVHDSNIRISSNIISDNNVGITNYRDQLCNLKLQINIDDAYLWDSRIKQTISMDGGLNVKPTNPDGSGDLEPITLN